MKIIDLSIPIEAEVPSDPGFMIPRINYFDHQHGAGQMESMIPGAGKEDLPGGLGWSYEEISLTTHSGTHLDAPYHYHPSMDKGKRALTIDEVPLEWCFSDGVVLDFSAKEDGYGITAKDVDNELQRIGYDIKPLDIVLIHTGADKYWGTPEYMAKGAGMTRESTLFLLEKGVKITGTDAWSWDRPLSYLSKEFRETKNPDVIWEAHFAGIEIGYCHMEKMANLDTIPAPFGFKVSCFPVKIKNASAGWVRPVCMVE